MLEYGIIVVGRNEGHVLERTLRQCLNYFKDKSYQILYIDSNSEDNSIEIATNLGIQTITTKRKGSAVARNIGLKNVKAEKLIMLDADMEIIPNGMNSVLNLLDENKIVTSDYTNYYHLSNKFEYFRHPHRIKYCGGFIAFHYSLLENLSYDEKLIRMQDVLFSYLLAKKSKSKIKICRKSAFYHHTIEYLDEERALGHNINNYFKYRGILLFKRPELGILMRPIKLLAFNIIVCIIIANYHLLYTVLYYCLIVIIRTKFNLTYVEIRNYILTDGGIIFGFFEELKSSLK